MAAQRIPDDVYIGFRQPEDASGPTGRLCRLKTPLSFENLQSVASMNFPLPSGFKIAFRFPVKDSNSFMKYIVILEETDMKTLGFYVSTGKLLDPIVAIVEHVRYHRTSGAIIARKVKNCVKGADCIGAHVKVNHPGL